MELDGTIFPLHVCAQAGDKAGIMHVCVGWDGMKLIASCASCTKALHTLEILIRASYDTLFSYSPLRCAWCLSMPRFAPQYLNNGYEVNAPDPDGRSPLVYAVVSGHLVCISTPFLLGSILFSSHPLFCLHPLYSDRGRYPQSHI